MAKRKRREEMKMRRSMNIVALVASGLVFSRKASFADGCCEDEWNGVAGTPWGLFYGAASQFAAEAIGTITNLVVAFTLPYVFFKILHAIIGMRVPAEVELQGLDVPEMEPRAMPDMYSNLPL
jgi:ammonia channel protein AmtB